MRWPLHVVDQRQQAVAQFDAQQVERQRGGDRFFLGAVVGLGFFFFDADLGFLGVLALVGAPGQRADAGGKSGEGEGRHAGQHGDDAHHGRGHAQRLGIEGQLAHQRAVGGAFDAGLGDHQARGGGNDQRRHLASPGRRRPTAG